jgi:phosphoglycolate phosphatase-like HAD superfamily hydrolase
MTAINAKIPSIMLTWGFDSREHLLEVGAKQFANDAKELYNAINRIFVN